MAIEEVGIRAGEKMHEELVTQEELSHLRKIKGYYVIDHIKGQRKGKYVTLKTAEYNSHKAPKMKQKEILDLLKKSKVI